MKLKIKALTFLLASLFSLVSVGDLLAQIPSTPGLSASVNLDAGALAGSAASSASAIPSAATTGVPETGLFGLGKPRTFPVVRYFRQQHAVNKAKLRASPLGDLVKGMLKPLSKLTGGVVPAEPTPNHVQLAAPGPQGSAAKIKLDQIEAPKRLAAIQELGQVDCHWYPEALEQLIFALRSDRSECVRYEAAKILTRCGCCTPAMLNALRVCVAGTETDGNPGERSLRIRDQAAIALENCLACADASKLQSAPKRPEYPNPEVAPSVDPNSYLSERESSDSRSKSNPVSQAGFFPDAKPPAKVNGKALIEQSEEMLRQYREKQSAAEKQTRSSLQDIWQSAK